MPVENASGKLKAEEKKFAKAEQEYNKAVKNQDGVLIKKYQIKMMTARHGIAFYSDQLARGLST